MPFGVATAPWAFTKLMREVISHLRKLGARTSGYIDDVLLAEARRRRLQAFVLGTVHPLLASLGL
eukprot:179338-Chlamydomonas_euryale.AAC.1